MSYIIIGLTTGLNVFVKWLLMKPFGTRRALYLAMNQSGLHLIQKIYITDDILCDEMIQESM